MIMVATVGNFFDQLLLTVVAPVYANEIYGSPASLGALVGSLGQASSRGRWCSDQSAEAGHAV
jgi:hypothetical protein